MDAASTSTAASTNASSSTATGTNAPAGITTGGTPGLTGIAAQVDSYITSIPDFPEPGIIFRDITSALRSAEGLRLTVDAMAACLDGVEFDAIAGLESRGFLFGMPIAYKLDKPFIPIRKKGKLPRATVSATYELEYGEATIEVHRDDVPAGSRIALVDDLIATGGTLAAAVSLMEKLDARVVKAVCLLELDGLHGRDKLPGIPVDAVVHYPGK